MGVRSEPRGGDLYERGLVLECQNCKWWTYKYHFSDDADLVDEVRSFFIDERYYGITKSFNINDKMLPIEVLMEELKKKPERLYDINPYKLEQLAQEILRGAYDCEVCHVGKTGDGGKDLIVLESDEPILVQVKRRENPNHVELIKGVREFVGTLFIEDKRKGIYISTAKRYSKASKEVAAELIKNRKLDYFKLVDYDKLCSLIGDIKERKHWDKLVKTFYECNNAGVYDSEELIRRYEGN
ncbi:MAG: restriction endonuclease [Lachnospiraceae bacterium]|nr:restriction endonuclease [Lachnospiraceae bacterium]